MSNSVLGKPFQNDYFAAAFSQSLRDFIYESNIRGQVIFVGPMPEAIKALVRN